PVERVQRASVDDGQQERAGNRILALVRGHGRRLLRDQGRPQDARLRARSGPQRARRARRHPRGGARQAPERRAASRPARQRLAAGLHRARPDPRVVRRRGHVGDRARRGRVRRRDGAQGRHARRPQRVQAAPSTAGCARVAEGLRQRPAPPDHEPLAWLNARLRAFYPELALVVTSFLYGATFTIVQDALDDLTATGFILLRFAIGGGGRPPARPPREWRGGGGRAGGAGAVV